MLASRSTVANVGLALLLAAGLAACKIDSTVYVPPGGDDDGDGGTADAQIDAPAGIYVVVTPSTTTVAEGGQVTVRVRLSEAPTVDRTILVVPLGNLLTPTPAMLTFTPENWMNERTVILAAGQDDDAVDSPVTVNFDGQGNVSDGTAMVMITDDDQQILIVTPPSSIGVTETGTGNVMVQLSAQPTSSVVVSVASMSSAVATVSPPQLTFTNANWDTSQSVTVTGTDDVNTSDDSTLLVLDPATEGIPTHSMAINVTDNDVVAIDATPSNLGTINEGDTMTGLTFNVQLTQMPGGNVTVGVTSPSTAIGLSTASLTFTPATYNINQQVTVTAPEDNNVVDEAVSIRLAAAGLSDRFVQVTVDDNDTQVVQVTPVSVPNLTEGASTNVSVRLAYQPAGAVIVDVASADPMVAAVNTNQLSFGPSDYDQPQTVRITGVDDIDLANEQTTVSFNAAAQGLTTNRTINVLDDDTQVLDVSPTVIAVNEGGQNTFGVRLLFLPSGNVTVNVAVAAPNALDISASPAVLTFTPGDYDVAQPVTVTGLQDSDVTNEQATVNVTSSGVPSRSVTVNLTDDDSLDIVVTPASVTVAEGDVVGQSIMVSLGAMPAGNVQVNLSTAPSGVASLSLSQLTFTTVNYATPQAVRVTGDQDPDGLDENTTIRLMASGLAEKTVPVTVTDDDVVTPVLSPNPHTIEEGKQDNTATVTLDRDPGRAVTVEVPSFGFTDFEVQPAIYNFDSTNWNIGQSVSLLAYEDDEDDDEQEMLTFVIAGEGQTTLTVNITDPTIIVGFRPPHNGLPAAINQLEAWKDGQMPICWTLEKVLVDVATAPSSMSKIAVGLYSDIGTQPGGKVWESFQLTVGSGPGLRTISVGPAPIYMFTAGSAWLALEATTGVTIKTSQTPNVSHCSRVHAFGDFMPNPFNAGGTGGMDISDGGLGTGDAGTVNVMCDTRAPIGLWLVGTANETCSNPM